jgi:acyl carrier protein
LQQRVNRQIRTENELVIDPAFFIALKEHLPKISRVEIVPKRGRYQNELTRFRYQVIIHAGPEEDRPTDISWLDWQKEKLSLPALRELLIEEEPEVLGIRRVSNARVKQAVEIVKLLAGKGGLQTASEVQDALGKIDERSVVDPEDLWALSREIPYSVNISWLDSGEEGSYDVVFVQQERERASSYRHPCFPGETVKSRTWSNYANNPGQKLLASELVPQLRSFLQGKLPDYMVPSLFVLLDIMPLMPNGKVDRKALPSPDGARPEMTEKFVAPRTPAEEVLAGIWGEILGIEKVGIQDNFFELGGHSLMATQIISRLSNVFQVEIPLRQLFLYPTISELALIIAGKLENTAQENVKQLLDEFEDLSDEDAERLLAQKLRQNEGAGKSE